ncbi:MAG: DUF1559 domain-containing protein [Pirellulales bacterium]|nr:DUF1559 domain-containing protein [Pirellulales bacterium]
MFLCASDDAPQYWGGNELYWSSPSSTQHQKRATSNYGASMGSQRFMAGYTGNYFNPNGYDSHGHSLEGSHLSGVFSHLAWGASIKDITDGTSNTIALGEVRPRCSWHVRDGWMHVNSLWIATSAPINYPSCPGESGYSSNSGGNTPKWSFEQGFKSSHPGGCQFVFADGSVHFLLEDIDYVTYQKLGDRFDDQSIDGF